MSGRASITPKVLKWARESARMSLETAASKIQVSPARLKEWEEGENKPTINQAQTLAKAYKRPFALFFLPEIPSDFQPLQDFRKHDSKPLGTASLFIIREIQQKQVWLSEFNQESGETPLPFVGKYNLNDNPSAVANDILTTLEISPGNYLYSNPMKEWIGKAELNGIFISRTSFINNALLLDKNELKGFAIADIYAPFIFINSDDWTAPQLFTLVHELAHIWIAKTGISNDIDLTIEPASNVHPIEVFCNEVAAAALMPQNILANFNQSIFSNNLELFSEAKLLGVSTLALITRAYNLRVISYNKYNELKSIAHQDFNNYIQKEEAKAIEIKKKDGGPSYYRLALNKNSRLFTQIILSYFKSGIIQPTTASSLLNVKVNNFSKLESLINQ